MCIHLNKCASHSIFFCCTPSGCGFIIGLYRGFRFAQPPSSIFHRFAVALPITSCLSPLTSYLSPLTSYLLPFTSCLSPLTFYLLHPKKWKASCKTFHSSSFFFCFVRHHSGGGI